MDPIRPAASQPGVRGFGRGVCAAMILAASGVLIAFISGAPMGAILVIGLLVLCPAGLWIVHRYERRATDRFRSMATSGAMR